MFRILASSLGSSPSLIPRFMVSAVPIIPIASSILLQIFADCPVPTWPQYTTLAPMQLRSSLADSNSSSAPPP
uniref:Uncharacterized protein n=1 Tax=Anguilla anguilla TaxID=7936 RepID=A0A0E9Q056_ANGAN